MKREILSKRGSNIFKNVGFCCVIMFFLSVFFAFPLGEILINGFFTFKDFTAVDFLNLFFQDDFLKALVFTLKQTISTAFIAICWGFVLALILNCDGFYHVAIVRFCESAFAVPTVVTGFAVLLDFGRSGWIGQYFQNISIYGLSGILLANLFYALPFATICFLQNFKHMPLSILRLRLLLNLSDWRFLKDVFLPYLLQPTILIFFQILLVTSQNFTLALELGGGPGSSTIETLIYQNIFFTFNLPKAISYAVMQTLIFGLLGYFAFLSIPQGIRVKTNTPTSIFTNPPGKILLFLYVAVASVLLMAIFLNGFEDQSTFQKFDVQSLIFALIFSSLFAFCASLIGQILVHVASLCSVWLKIFGYPVLSQSSLAVLFVLATASPVVMSFGYLLWAGGQNSAFKIAAIPIVQSVGLFAFLLPLHFSEIKQVVEQTDKLIALLGLSYWKRVTAIYWPAFKSSIQRGVLLGFLIVFGQFSVTAVLAKPQVETVTGLIYRLMGQYRYQHAALVSSIFLLVIALLLILVHFFSRIERFYAGR